MPRYTVSAFPRKVLQYKDISLTNKKKRKVASFLIIAFVVQVRIGLYQEKLKPLFSDIDMANVALLSIKKSDRSVDLFRVRPSYLSPSSVQGGLM